MRWWLLALLGLAGCDAMGARHTAVRHPPVVCPMGTRFDGASCLLTWYLSDVRCPPGSRWQTDHCEAREVRCPSGSRWDGVACVAPVAALASADVPVPPRDDLADPFADDRTTEGRPLPPASDGVIDPFVQTHTRRRPLVADEVIDPWSLQRSP
jgi:hypothetical protein